jgi:calcineurin-like phosphoesterase family protein
MSIWFTADTHFGHFNIMKYCGRPFETTQQQDETIIKNWNDRVKEGDTVYHLGDFCFIKSKKSAEVEQYIERLNGRITLVVGNHDHSRTRKANGFAEVTCCPYKEIKVGEQLVVLSHYAMLTWNKRHYGAWQLYGHTHGVLPNDRTRKQERIGGTIDHDDIHPGHFDVGVDCWDFKPISFDEVAVEMKKYPIPTVE